MATVDCQPSSSSVALKAEVQETASEFVQRCQQMFGPYTYFRMNGVIAIYSPETEFLNETEVLYFFNRKEWTCKEAPTCLPSNAPGSYSFIVPDSLYNVKMGPNPLKRKALKMRTDWINKWTDMKETKKELIEGRRVYTSEKYSNPNGMKRQFGFITDTSYDVPERQLTVFYQYIIPGDVTLDETAIPSPGSPRPESPAPAFVRNDRNGLDAYSSDDSGSEACDEAESSDDSSSDDSDSDSDSDSDDEVVREPEAKKMRSD